MKGIITTIQRMSIHDGPGIRSTIFMKGCNLRCMWCHNPETFFFQPEIEWIKSKCISCAACISHCPHGALTFDAGEMRYIKTECTNCMNCLPFCYPEALRVIGREITPEQALAEVEEDFPYFEKSNGGVTISGGEPLMQWEFVKETLKGFKRRGIHTAIETNLNVSWAVIEKVLPWVDLVMADIKIMDSRKHVEWTGSTNTRILKNILNLDKSSISYCLRTPVVPGVNDNDEAIGVLAEFVSTLSNIERYELLPFHPLADSKYQNLGIRNPFENKNSINPDDMERYNTILQKHQII
jgi:pyruvate formate lyase activating enzyme